MTIYEMRESAVDKIYEAQRALEDVVANAEGVVEKAKETLDKLSRLLPIYSWGFADADGDSLFEHMETLRSALWLIDVWTNYSEASINEATTRAEDALESLDRLVEEPIEDDADVETLC